MAQGNQLNREKIHELFNELGAALNRRGLLAEFAIYGGGAIALQYDFRAATGDIDFYPIKECTKALETEATSLAQVHNLPKDWLNCAIADILHASHHTHFGDFPVEAPGLRVFVAVPEYILATKILAMRSVMDSHDPLDVWHLLDACQVTTMEDVDAIMSQFFSDGALPRRNYLIVSDMLEAKQKNEPYSPLLGV